jgi:hypothetical protein
VLLNFGQPGLIFGFALVFLDGFGFVQVMEKFVAGPFREPISEGIPGNKSAVGMVVSPSPIRFRGQEVRGGAVVVDPLGFTYFSNGCWFRGGPARLAGSTFLETIYCKVLKRKVYVLFWAHIPETIPNLGCGLCR